MGHEDWFELISAEADGELTTGESERLAGHLTTCASCRGLLGRFESERRRIRLRSATTGDHLVHEILASSANEAGLAETRSVLARRATIAVAGIAAAMVAVVLTLSGGSPAPSQSAVAGADAGAQITAASQSFDRSDVHVKAGTTVEWRNSSGITHHLIRELGDARVGGDLPPGGVETVTFERPGKFVYHCALHPEMSGTVTVET